MSLPRSQTSKAGVPTLAELCINLVVKELERYPAVALGIVDEYQWDIILKLRHRKTKPLRGKGGIDGRGRLHPAVSDKFMQEVEESNPHLSESKVADELIWKDIVEYKFKKGGLSRPKGLLYPWPVLVQQLEDAGKMLSDCLKLLGEDADAEADREKTEASTLHAIKCISESPMDLNLLKTSGIGKKVKKFLNKSTRFDFLDEPYIYSSGKDIRKTPRTTLEATLQAWKDIAAESGVKMKDDHRSGARPKAAPTASILTAAKKCDSWRSLYHTLKVHDEDRRSKQGEKMRERRRRLDTVRPKIVKVRPASTRQDRILGKASIGSGYNPTEKPSAGSSKIRQLRMEARAMTTRRQGPVSPATGRRQTGGFGAAVAFASVGKKVAGRRKTAPITKSVSLAGGKRIAVPDAKSTGNANLHKRLKMLKRGQSSFRP